MICLNDCTHQPVLSHLLEMSPACFAMVTTQHQLTVCRLAGWARPSERLISGTFPHRHHDRVRHTGSQHARHSVIHTFCQGEWVRMSYVWLLCVYASHQIKEREERNRCMLCRDKLVKISQWFPSLHSWNALSNHQALRLHTIWGRSCCQSTAYGLAKMQLRSVSKSTWPDKHQPAKGVYVIWQRKVSWQSNEHCLLRPTTVLIRSRRTFLALLVWSRDEKFHVIIRNWAE